MYFKKIAIAIVLIGLIGAGIFSYYIYSVMLVPNTNFNSEEAYIFVSSDATFAEVRADLEPLLKNIETFETLAKQKKYVNNIKAGRFLITKGMTNNDISQLYSESKFTNKNSVQQSTYIGRFSGTNFEPN